MTSLTFFIGPRTFKEECQLWSGLGYDHKSRRSIDSEVDKEEPNIIYSMLGVLRLLLATRDLAESASKSSYSKDWLDSLMDHLPELGRDPQLTKHLNEIVELFLTAPPEGLGLAQTFGADQIRHAYGVLRVNSFGVVTSQGGQGRALFPLTALLSHSCSPNLLHKTMAKRGSGEKFHSKRSIALTSTIFTLLILTTSE